MMRRSIHRANSEGSLDPLNLMNGDISENDEESVVMLQQSLQDVLHRRRRLLSMDVCEHINTKRSENKSSDNRRLPPRPSSTRNAAADCEAVNFCDSDDATDVKTEAASEWVDSGETTLSSSSLNNTITSEGPSCSRGRGRGRGLLRGLSRRLKGIDNKDNKSVGNAPEEDWASMSDDMSRSIGGDVNSTDGQTSKRFLLQKVDSIRMARVNRREAKTTALEESLMQQLANMQTDQENEMCEMNLKLRQREAAIKTLENALTIKTETVDSLRTDLEQMKETLDHFQAKLKKQEKKLTRRERSLSPCNLSVGGDLSSRRRLKEKKTSPRSSSQGILLGTLQGNLQGNLQGTLQGTLQGNLQEQMESDAWRRAESDKTRKDANEKKLLADGTVKSVAVAVSDLALRRPHSDHHSDHHSKSNYEENLFRPFLSEHDRMSAAPPQQQPGKGRYLDDSRSSDPSTSTSTSRDEYQSKGSAAICREREDDRRRPSVGEHKARRRCSYDNEVNSPPRKAAGRSPRRRSSTEETRNHPTLRRESVDSFAKSRASSRRLSKDNARAPNRGATDSRDRGGDSQDRADRPRRKEQDEHEVNNKPTAYGKKILSLDGKIQKDRRRRERRATRGEGSLRRSSDSWNDCDNPPRRQKSNDGLERSSSNSRPPSGGSGIRRGVQRSESARFSPTRPFKT